MIIGCCYFPDSIPYEMSLKIARELDYPTLKRLMGVSKKAYQVANEKNLWENLYSQYWKSTPLPSKMIKYEFMARFKGETHWKNNRFSISISRNFVDPTKKLHFYALSNQTSLIIKNSNSVAYIPKKKFAPSQYLFKSPAKFTLDCMACSDQKALLGWSSNLVNIVPFASSQEVQFLLLPAKPTALDVLNETVLAGCDNGCVYWTHHDLNSGTYINLNSRSIKKVGFISSYENSTLIYSLNQNKNVYFVDILARELLGLYENANITTCTNGANNSFLMGTLQNGLYCKDILTRSEPTQLFTSSSAIKCLQSLNNLIAVGQEDGLSSLWDVRMTRSPAIQIQHQSPIVSVAIADQKLVSGSYNGSLKISDSSNVLDANELMTPIGFATTSIHLDNFKIFGTFANGFIAELDASSNFLSYVY